MNFFSVPITIFIFITNPISAINKCNDECLTKTYCLSSSGTTLCSKNNLVSATWSVIARSGYDDDSDDLVGLTLKAEKIGQSETRWISLIFASAKSQTNYTCSKSLSGVTAVVTQKDTLIIQGTPSYSSGILTCFWSFTKTNTIWPLYFDVPAELISDKSGSLTLESGDKRAIVARDVAGLPIYKLQYLKCCNNVHGNDQFITIFNQTKDNYYLIRSLDSMPKVLTLSLNSSKGMQLIFNCDFTNNKIDGFVADSTKKTNIADLLQGRYVYRLFNRQCHWSHPLTLTGTFGKIDTTTDVYDMKIISDGSVVYTEKGVKLKNSASKLLSITSILTMIISIFLNLSL